jgi:hypothetical protein
MSDNHYVGENGTYIIINVKSDISTATSLIMMVQKPSGIKVRWTASLLGLSSARYKIRRGDMNEEGTYTVQLYLEMPDWAGWAVPITFHVERPIVA